MKAHAPTLRDCLAQERAGIGDERRAIASERDLLAEARELAASGTGAHTSLGHKDVRALLVAARLRDEAAIIRDLAANRRDLDANRAAAQRGTGGMGILLIREWARTDRAASRSDRMASATDRWQLCQHAALAMTT